MRIYSARIYPHCFKEDDMIKILFVCHGNICRSPMAEFVMKKLLRDAGLSEEFKVQSAAASREEIGNDMHYGAKRVLREHGIPFEKRAAVQITAADYGKYDYIAGMDVNNVRDMLRIFGGDPQRKVCRLLEFAGLSRDVADPWYTGDFDTAYSDVSEGCAALLSAAAGRVNL